MAINFTRLLGISGVALHERPKALFWAHRLEWPILILALWVPFQWYLEEAHIIRHDSVRVFDWLIWLVFLFETTLLTTLVRDKWRYLLTNWMNLVIIVAGIPLEWVNSPVVGALRNLRLVLMLYLLAKLSRRLRQFLAKGRVGTILFISVIVVMLAGIIVTRLDPSMGSIWDGMWWAWVTLTHTGYGDIVPVTASGRVFAAFLIFLGVVLISLMTANLSAFLIGSEVEKVEKEEKVEESMLRDLSARLDRIEKLLEQQTAAKESAPRATHPPKPD
jgi:voltage-gated potassium channel